MRANLAKIFGGIAILLIILILVGFLRPAHWTAEVSVQSHLDPDVIFTYLNDLEKWDEWTMWSDIDSEITDPSHGEGAMRTWQDEYFGSGKIRIVESYPPTILAYEVTNDSGAWVFGEFRLTVLPTSTLITWTEQGDLGNNPLMGYLAERIGHSQQKQMASGLESLKLRASD